MITILNTSILTTTGTFNLKDITLQEARELIQNNEWQSAVGHQSTADVLTTLLETKIPENRVPFEQSTGETALIFKLNGRPAEGQILTAEEIHQMGFKFQILTKIAD